MPGNSGKIQHKVSRHTMVIRKAREDDAKRLAGVETGSAPGAGTGVRLGKPGPAAGRPRRSSTEAVRKSDRPADAAAQGVSTVRRVVSGRMIVVEKEAISPRISSVTRFFGPDPRSVRVTGGDAIVRYDSGRMVIRRGARRASLRRRLLVAYAAGYFLLFGVYGYFLLFGTVAVAPADFVQKAFGLRSGDRIPDLERAAFDAMRGNRTPAEVRLAEMVSFYDEEKSLVRIEAGSRLTLPDAAKLGKAIIDDRARPEASRVFVRPLRLYRETSIALLDWPHWLAVYNSAGFFLLIVLFLWRPIADYLNAQGRKTAAALRNARAAREESLKFEARHAELASEIDGRRTAMLAEAGKEAKAALAEALDAARAQADAIENGVLAELEFEAGRLSARLGADAALRACDEAQEILRERLGEAEHAAAIEALIAGIAAARPAGEPG
ncbi:MAG: hypothetical protein LBE84_11050 [Planctomycetota bacterium]|jgi:F0F1-type ATP synthase membrane subunit b/b'|nr:hypothetical protein [Planctomycetota bacterium]